MPRKGDDLMGVYQDVNGRMEFITTTRSPNVIYREMRDVAAGPPLDESAAADLISEFVRAMEDHEMCLYSP